jgi:hypothetical protein
LMTLISTLCPAWQWPGKPHKKKWWPAFVNLMESLPVFKVVKGADVLHDLYIGCVTLITLCCLGLYSKTGHTNYKQF